MLARRDGRRELFPGQKCSQRKAGGNWFRDGDNVGRHAEGLEGKNVPGAAQSALDLVKNQRGTMTVGNRPAFLQEIHRAFIYAAFPENGLQHNGAGIFIHCRT